jgi:endonuclease G
MIRRFWIFSLFALFAVASCTSSTDGTSDLTHRNTKLEGQRSEENFRECRHFFPSNNPPLINVTAQGQHLDLCYQSFAVLYSKDSKTPLYSAQRLTKQTLDDALGERRSNRFYEENRIPEEYRSTLEDYKGSGFDRGHLAPSADMPTPAANDESFSLANIFPQAPRNNQRPWAQIERATRKYVRRSAGSIYVITGVTHDPSSIKMIGPNRVWVPKYIYKVVYDENEGRAWAHWIENNNDAKIEVPITIDQLEERTGIRFNITPSARIN